MQEGSNQYVQRDFETCITVKKQPVLSVIKMSHIKATYNQAGLFIAMSIFWQMCPAFGQRLVEWFECHECVTHRQSVNVRKYIIQ